MDNHSSNMQARPTPREAMRDKVAKIDAELLRCQKRVDDLQLIESLQSSDTLQSTTF